MIHINLMTKKLKVKLDARRYYEKNRANILAEQKEYQKTHPQPVGYSTEHSRRWRKKNPVKARQQRRESVKVWKRTHPEEHHRSNRRQNRRYQKLHPEYGIAATHRRRARKKGNGGSWTVAEWMTLKRQYGFRCVSCWRTEDELKTLGLKLVPDHIISIKNGGMNHITNLQPLCHGFEGCNNYKSSKTIDYVIS